jgi:hypothetical protein
MERKRVNSSKVRSIGYDERNLVLEVELNDGSVYQFSGVSPEVHRRFVSAPSLVSYYQDKIEEEFPRKRLR